MLHRPSCRLGSLLRLDRWNLRKWNQVGKTDDGSHFRSIAPSLVGEDRLSVVEKLFDHSNFKATPSETNHRALMIHSRRGKGSTRHNIIPVANWVSFRY